MKYKTLYRYPPNKNKWPTIRKRFTYNMG